MLGPGDGRVAFASLIGDAAYSGDDPGARPFLREAVIVACAPHSSLQGEPGIVGEILRRLAD